MCGKPFIYSFFHSSVVVSNEFIEDYDQNYEKAREKIRGLSAAITKNMIEQFAELRFRHFLLTSRESFE